MCEHYLATEALRQIVGVGPITALTFVLTIEDSQRSGDLVRLGVEQPRSDGVENRLAVVVDAERAVDGGTVAAPRREIDPWW